jgi:hypothetical protein
MGWNARCRWGAHRDDSRAAPWLEAATPAEAFSVGKGGRCPLKLMVMKVVKGVRERRGIAAKVLAGTRWWLG